MSNYAIGDIQVCFSELIGLLDLINFDKKRDRLWLAGDLVNRGPESLKTLEFIYSIRDSCNIVLGNLDLHLLSIAEGLRTPNKEDTLNEVFKSKNLPIYIKWLRGLSLYYHEKIHCNKRIKTYLMTHAGIPPHWTWEDLKRASKEIEKAIKEDYMYKDYLKNLYGDFPSKNFPNISKIEKLRLNTNYFTRMRFCKLNGELDLTMGKIKGTREENLKNFKPWFQHPLKIKLKNLHIIFGHWAGLGGKTGIPNITAIDTGCVWGYKLSAFRLEDSQVFSYDRLN